MTDKERVQYEANMIEYLKAKVSRSQMLKVAGAGLALATVSKLSTAEAAGVAPTSTSFPFFPQVTGTYTPEAIGDIVNIAVTAEYLAVTLLTAVVGNATTLGLNALLLAVIQAALVEEQDHLDFLTSVGASPLTTTFTVPNPKILTDQVTLFSTLEVAESIFVGAYMAAVREFSELGQPLLAKYAYQIGAVEAEHRVLARAALALSGMAADIPPNNKGYETDLFLYVRDAAAVLVGLGFIGGTGTAAAYPGRAAALAAAGPMVTTVVQQMPNNATTSLTATDNLTGPRT